MKKSENKSFIKNSPQDNLRSLAIILSAVICAASGLLSYQIEGTFYPLVIQNMMCLFFAGIFGGFSGAAVSGITLMMGALGLPIFSFGSNGLASLSGETGGFLIGYFIASLFVGIFLGKPQEEKTPMKKIIISLFIGFLIIYIVGIFQYFKSTHIKFSFTILERILYTSIPLFILDFIKLIITSIATYFLRPVCAKYFYKGIE